MIKATISIVLDGLQLEMRDHATGSPQVCAGASAIAWALAGWLLNHPAAEAVTRMAPGESWIRCRRTAETETAFEVATVGLRQIEAKYGDYISVEVKL